MFRNFLNNKKKNTASLAKERLQIIISHERVKDSVQKPDFFHHLQKEILEVIRRHIPIEDDQVMISIGKKGDSDILELNVVLNGDEEEN